MNTDDWKKELNQVTAIAEERVRKLRQLLLTPGAVDESEVRIAIQDAITPLNVAAEIASEGPCLFVDHEAAAPCDCGANGTSRAACDPDCASRSGLYAVVEAYQGVYHQGFETRDEAIAFVHRKLDETGRDEDYAYRVLQVSDEWNSDDLLPGER